MTEQEQREAVVKEAYSWLGTPFKHAAGVKEAGCDCAHLITEVYKAKGHMPAIEYPQYGPDFWRHTDNPEKHIVETGKKYFREITEAEAQNGDWFVLYIGRCWAHCGIITDKVRHLAVEAWPTHKHVLEIYTKEEKLFCTHDKRYFSPWGMTKDSK